MIKRSYSGKKTSRCFFVQFSIIFERPLQNAHILQDYNMRVKIFKFSARVVPSHPKFHPSPLVSGSKFSWNQPQVRLIYPDFCVRAHLSNQTGRYSRILAPFLKLKANCLNMTSMIFFISFGNLALFPLSCRWLMPKYCSTMYRNFEMALFLAISVSVSLALILSLRIIPS